MSSVFRLQQASRTLPVAELDIPVEDNMSERGSIRSHLTNTAGDDDRKRAMEPWRRFAPRWEAWAGGWGVRNDPSVYLALYFRDETEQVPGYKAYTSATRSFTPPHHSSWLPQRYGQTSQHFTTGSTNLSEDVTQHLESLRQSVPYVFFSHFITLNH